MRTILLFMSVLNTVVLSGCAGAATGHHSNASDSTKEKGVNSDYSARMDDDYIQLSWQDKPILSYRHSVMDVPEGVNPLFKRSGFIHPLYSPAGKVLTRVQPKDHYHHYGIWNPWTKTTIEGREIDFWNLAKGDGTVRFAEVLAYTADPDSASFKVRQEHVMFKPTEKVAIDETWDIRASACRVEGKPAWTVDFVSTLRNVLETPIVLDAYRYGGGLGFRAVDDWTKDNCVVLTSEGKTRADADGTRARWCDVRGPVGDNDVPSGILFLSHPGNQEHPEPMRVWPLDANGGRGDMFFEFCPIRLNAWTLEPQKQYVLRYRMIVYDGTLKPQTAEVLWNDFVQPQSGK
jgi:uncharacterized protein YceK